MTSNTRPGRGRGVLAAVATLVVVVSAVAAGVSLTAVGTASAAPTQVSSCTTIDEPGAYELAGNVTDTTPDGSCIRITTSDVTLDGNGYTVVWEEEVDESYTINTPLIRVGGTDPVTNVSVSNATVRIPQLDLSPSEAVTYRNVSDSSLSNVGIDTSSFGHVLIDGENNTVRNVRPVNASFAPLRVEGDDNRIVDSVGHGAGDGIGVVVEGDGNVLENVTGYGTGGAEVVGSDNVVRNATFEASDQSGVVVRDGGNNTVANTTSVVTRGTSPSSLSIGNSSSNEVRGNRLVDGLNLYGESESNLIYDNVINGTDPVVFDNPASGNVTAEPNTWNVSARSGENVVGGDTVGGNYYANTDGTGFSQTCEDADSDGICDSPTELGENNTDYLPLADPANGTDGGDGTDDGDGNESETNATNYQVDFVAGQPIEDLSEDALYAQQDRLFRFAFGNASAGITDRGSAWASDRLRNCVEYGHVVSTDDGDTAQVTFTVADDCSNVTLSLVTYSLPGETFSLETADQQELLNATTGTYGPGEHTITVDLPDESED